MIHEMLLVVFLIAMKTAEASGVSDIKWNFHKSGQSSRCLDELYEIERRIFLISSRISSAGSDAKILHSLVNHNFIVNVLESVANANIGGNIGIDVGSASLNNIHDVNYVYNENVNYNYNYDNNDNNLENNIYNLINITIDDYEPILRGEVKSDTDLSSIEVRINMINSTSQAAVNLCNNVTKLCADSNNFNSTPPKIIDEPNETLPIVIPSSVENINQTRHTLIYNDELNGIVSQQDSVVERETVIPTTDKIDQNLTFRNNSKSPVQSFEPIKISLTDGTTTTFPIYINASGTQIKTMTGVH